MNREREHYFTFFVNVEYIQDCDFSDNIEKFMDDITLNDKDLKEFIRGYIASGFTRKHHKCFYIEEGPGDNGKSVLNNIRKKIFGKFYCSVGNDVVGERPMSSAGSSKSHLIPLIGARIGGSTELGPNERLNEGFIKASTGGDDIGGIRDLFQKGSDMRTTDFKQFTLIVQLNDLPEIKPSQQTLLERIRVVPFNAKFYRGEKYETYKQNDNVSLADDDFISKLTSEDDLNGTIKQPEIVLKRKKEFISECDPLASFYEEVVEITGDESDYIEKRTFKGLILEHIKDNQLK
eukprot:Awhi_evm1s5423